MKRNVPKGWRNYSKCGKPIPGTVLLAFKVPLNMDTCQRSLPESEWFTSEALQQLYPNLRLIINLTQCPDGRYYDFSDFVREGIRVVQIEVAGGGQLPRNDLVKRFCRIVDDFRRTADPDGLIGVHCTHGVNRTGYFICKYLTRTLKIRGEQAIELFEAARGETFDRQNYTIDIISSSK